MTDATRLKSRFSEDLDNPRQTWSENRIWAAALGLSVLLHALLFMPSLYRDKWLTTRERLVEVSLVPPQARKKTPRRPAPPVHKRVKRKPKVKPKIKNKARKKPVPTKKRKVVDQKSALARKKSHRRKSAPPRDRLAEIKKRLARQREEQQLEKIRQRLRQDFSPAAKARQATLSREYQMLLKAWLMRNWHLPEHLLNSGLEAVVSLTIDASGNLLAQKEEKLSGNLLFDNAMRQAIINAAPFPPFPEELKIPREEFVITFNPNNLKP